MEKLVERKFIVITAIIIAVVMMGISLHFNDKNKKLKATIEAINIENSKVEKEIKDQLLRLEAEKEALQKKLADPAKQNIDDMKAYIQARYSKVPEELAELIAIKTNALAKKHDVDFSLVVGLMEVESSYNPFAVSSVGAVGLLQVMPKVWSKTYHIEKATDLHGVEKGISVGIRVLKHYIDKNKGGLSKALQDYNGSNGSKGRAFSDSVFLAVGRFTSFRNNTYKVEEEADDPDERATVSADDSKVR
jgi:soluble lytic murein transglycosylase-like protein